MVSTKKFRFPAVFTQARGQRWKTSDHVPGEVPYISSSGFDNGIAAYVTPPPFMELHNNKMTLANSGTVGVLFFHPYDFVASDHCMVLGLTDPNVTLDEDLFLYLRPIVEAIRGRYNFGREISERRLKREVFELPVDENGEPDWEFMRRRSREIRAEIRFNSVPQKSLRPLDLWAVNWGEFTLSELFTEIHPGKCGNAQLLLTDGNDMPYIGAKRNDYGVMRTVARPSDEKLILKGPCIALICDGQGSVGYSTFVPFQEFVGTTTVKFAYHQEIDLKVATFLTTVLDRNRPRFSFGRKWGARVDKTIVSLPVTIDSEPDFDFMRAYVDSLTYATDSVFA